MIAIPRRIDHEHRQRIAQAARERLRHTRYPSLHTVSCVCDEAGVLFLQGHLASFHHKQLAQEAILDLEGVTQVVNDIEVVEHPNDHRSGSEQGDESTTTGI